jgi:hypothetical protein
VRPWRSRGSRSVQSYDSVEFVFQGLIRNGVKWPPVAVPTAQKPFPNESMLREMIRETTMITAVVLYDLPPVAPTSQRWFRIFSSLRLSAQAVHMRA